MKSIGDTAFAVSVHYEATEGTLRINLKWQGNHDISAFDLGRLGKVLHYEADTEDTGWVIVEPYNRLSTYPEGFLPPSAPPTAAPSFLVSPGDAIPLRNRDLTVSKSPTDFACFLLCLMVCAKERRSVTVARCLTEELAKCCRGSGITRQHG
jgi:hypothetical protein